jgi:septal ring factor EnvC (AmiA/AmiB activator)
VCDAKYVRADWLEGTTWKEIKAVLQNPDLILEQVKREMQSCRNGGNIQNIDNEIAMLERRIRSYAGQKKRLLQAFKFGEFEKDDILDELVKVRRDREADERKLQELKRTRAALTALVQAEAKLNAFCQKAAHNLEHCTAEDKKLALDMLDIKAYATSNRLEIHGIIPMEFVTIEQTSA